MQKRIFDYLKKNKFINAESCSSNVKWPGIVCRKQQNFLVHLVLQEDHYMMSNKKVDKNNNHLCSVAIICQELKHLMTIDFDFDFVSKGYQQCATECLQWKSVNEKVFMLHQALVTEDIT